MCYMHLFMIFDKRAFFFEFLYICASVMCVCIYKDVFENVDLYLLDLCALYIKYICFLFTRCIFQFEFLLHFLWEYVTLYLRTRLSICRKYPTLPYPQFVCSILQVCLRFTHVRACKYICKFISKCITHAYILWKCI